LREALANIAKHARASRAAVRVEVRAHDVLFEVTDDGIGPPPGALGLTDSGHFGLRQMLERLEALGGSVDFERGVPTGFCLRGVLPLR
jgi:signal transduction histidine kinase